jgi:prepilin-type N-terminal cleavage/methylation domain-containing protein
MMRRRERSKAEKGFTLVEMILAALIMSILMTVVARLFLGSFKGWLFNYSALTAQAKARIYRDTIIKRARQAQASTVEISQYNTNVPPRSMLTFTDATGMNWAFLQKDNTVIMGPWYLNSTTGLRELSKTADTTVIANTAIGGKVERLVFYYPDAKDLNNLNFALDLEWTLLADNKLKPVTIQMVGEIEIRDP